MQFNYVWLTGETFSGLVFKANGEVIPTEPANGTDYELAQLKEIVGGMLGIVPLHDVQIEGIPEGEDLIMILNEEGKLMSLEVNLLATSLWEEVVGVGVDVIVGD